MGQIHGGNVFDSARKLNIPVADLCDFSANINPLGPPKGWKEILHFQIDTLIHYPDSSYREYRESIAQRFGIHRDFVIAGNGVSDILWLFARTLRPKKVVIISPTFSEYESAFRPWSSEIVHVLTDPLELFHPDYRTIERALDQAELLVLCNPNNPTGTLTNPATVQKLIDLTADRGVRCLVDESFIEFATNAESVLNRPVPNHLFVLRSQTKIGAVPGLRVGFAVCTDRDVIAKMKQYGDSWAMNSLAAAYGSFLVDQREYIESSRIETDRLRAKLIDSLFATGVLAPFPSAANFVLCRILGSLTADQLCVRAEQQGILVRNGGSFVGLNNRFVRIAVRPEREQERLVRFLRDL